MKLASVIWVLATSLLLSLTQGKLSECQPKLLGMFFNAKDLPSFITTYMDSGRGIDQLGNQSLCNADPTKDYKVLTLNFSTLYLGICGPVECTIDDYLSLGPSMDQAINKGKPLPVLVSIHQPHQSAPLDEIPTAGKWLIAVFGLIVLFAIVGSMVEYFTIRNYREDAKKRFTTFHQVTTVPYYYVDQDIAPEQEVSSDLKEEWDKISSEFHVEALFTRYHEFTQPLRSWKKFVVNFSLISSCYSLTAQRVDDSKNGNLNSLNGVRLFSILWVVLGHSYQAFTFGPLLNGQAAVSMIKRFPFLVILNGTFSVDTFFFLSGLLCSYLFSLKFSNLNRNTSVKSLPLIYLHRFIRLTPLVLFVTIFAWKVYPYLGFGPVFYQNAILFAGEACDDSWWTNIVYLNNFLPSQKQGTCVPQLWYLADDMQFFILAVLIMVIYHQVAKSVALGIMGLLCTASWITIWLLTDKYNFPPSVMGADRNFFLYYYYSPYCRIPPYLVGMFVGLFYYEHKKNGRFQGYVNMLRNKRVIRMAHYLIGIALVSHVVFIIYPVTGEGDEWTTDQSAAYLTFSRTAFVIGVGLIVVPTFFLHSGVIKSILSNYLFAPLAKLTYGIYVIHFMILYAFIFSVQSTLVMNDLNVLYVYLGVVVTSMMAALILYLFIEMPFAKLDQTYLSSRVKRNMLKNL